MNCSPKGLPNASFAVFDDHSCAYIDSTGSGNETISHIYENGRVTVMFCSFDRLPRIMRWYCTGSVVELGDQRWEGMLRKMGKKETPPGARAIVLLEVWKVTTSCGTGVPIIGEVQSLEEEMEVRWNEVHIGRRPSADPTICRTTMVLKTARPFSRALAKS